MKTWWIVANDSSTGNMGGWHWRTFFGHARRSRGPYQWGGPTWIRSGPSRALIREMREGDLVIAYQARVGVIGFAHLQSGGYSCEGDESPDCFDLSTRGALKLARPIPLVAVRALPDARLNFGFIRFQQSTVHRVSAIGRRRIGLLAGAFDPSVAARCRTWAGVDGG
jgi:hypothetical protein